MANESGDEDQDKPKDVQPQEVEMLDPKAEAVDRGMNRDVYSALRYTIGLSIFALVLIFVSFRIWMGKKKVVTVQDTPQYEVYTSMTTGNSSNGIALPGPKEVPWHKVILEKDGKGHIMVTVEREAEHAGQ